MTAGNNCYTYEGNEGTVKTAFEGGDEITNAADCITSGCANWEVCVPAADQSICIMHIDDERLVKETEEEGGSTAVVVIFVMFGLITALAVGYLVKCYCCGKNKRSDHDSDSDNDYERN